MVGKPLGLPHSYFSLKSICVNLLGTPQPSWLIQAERRRLFQNHLHQSCARPATPRSNQGPLIQFDLSLKVSESLCKLFGAEITWRFFRSHWGTPKSSKSLNYFSIETLLVTCVSPWFHKVPLEDKPNNIPTTTSCWVSMWLFSHVPPSCRVCRCKRLTTVMEEPQVSGKHNSHAIHWSHFHRNVNMHGSPWVLASPTSQIQPRIITVLLYQICIDSVSAGGKLNIYKPQTFPNGILKVHQGKPS